MNKLRNQYETIEKDWTEQFGYSFSELTEWEAKFILNSGKKVDESRDIIFTKGQKRSIRVDDEALTHKK